MFYIGGLGRGIGNSTVDGVIRVAATKDETGSPFQPIAPEVRTKGTP